ncbi:hypothetical protein HPB48_010851 [Haemaphysalis longicornis]|uniref:Ionotropic receptor n=1 Tax=Haemaphysalis longicornis TaxID=44386 RepID=A0A9J6GYB9_HAELO|nr:hypothetical protein HPB48_010851 [Haemaphysalis longicornis]
MRKLSSLYILAALSLINLSATKSPNVLQCVLNESLFQRPLSIIGKAVQLYIVASSACLQESPAPMKRFLSHASIPPRAFFTQLSAVRGHPYTCDGTGWMSLKFSDELCIRSVILVVCDRPPWEKHLRRPPKFLAYLLLDTGAGSIAARLTNDSVFREYSQEVNFFEAGCAESNTLFSLNSEPLFGTPVWKFSEPPSYLSQRVPLRPQLPGSEGLGGVVLTIRCVHYTTCRQPGFELFVKLLRSKNATVHVHRDQSFVLSYHQIRNFQRSLGPGSIIYNPAQEISQSTAIGMLYPHLTVVRFLESQEMKIFVKKPRRFPKSAVLVLPLQWPVWVVLACTYLFFLALFRAQIFFRSTRRSERGNGLGFVLVSSMLQQSARVTFRERNRSVRKAGFGLWLILALVVSSAFKGSLTSLLKNIPLTETLHRFVGGDNGSYVGYNVASLECTRNYGLVPSQSPVAFPAGDNYGVCFVQRLTFRSTSKTYIIANGFYKELLDIASQELDKLGYTWVDGDVGTGLAGPVVPYASPYKHALAALLQKSLEAGLFQRARDLDHFKAVYKRGQTLLVNLPPDDRRLILSDLEPYFTALIVGLTASLVAALAELLTYHCGFSLGVKNVCCTVARARMRT